MFREPGTQRGGHDGGVLGLVDHAERLLLLERGLDVVEEGNGQGVALVEVGHVGVEARFGVLVGQEADVGEFIPEDWEIGTCWLAGHDGKGGWMDE